jgi:hypothetical protein
VQAAAESLCARPFFILSQEERDSARSAEKEMLTFAINSGFAVGVELGWEKHSAKRKRSQKLEDAMNK